MFSEFLDAIDGKVRHIIQPDEIWREMEILLAATRAGDTGEPQEV